MQEPLGALSGSREPSRSVSALTGFDPERWQPIETAPMDGTNVLVLLDCATVPVVHIAWFRSQQEWEESGQYCGSFDGLEEWLGWWSYTRGSVTQEKLDGYRTPTHWMPLPEPPSA